MKASGGDAGWSKAKKRHMRMGRSAAVGSAGNIMEAAPFFNFFLILFAAYTRILFGIRLFRYCFSMLMIVLVEWR